MGCITGCAAKVILTVFNGVVAAGAGAMILLASLASSGLSVFGEWVPKQTYQLNTALQSTGSFVLMLGILGIVTVCCCHNKLFLGVYSIIGIALVVCVLTPAGVGLGKLEESTNSTLEAIQLDVSGYSTLEPDHKLAVNQYFSDGECCGSVGPSDFGSKLPPGCCGSFTGNDTASLQDPCPLPDAFEEGCASKAQDVFDKLAHASYTLGIVFGLALLALIITTYVLIKCTDALPI